MIWTIRFYDLVGCDFRRLDEIGKFDQVRIGRKGDGRRLAKTS